MPSRVPSLVKALLASAAAALILSSCASLAAGRAYRQPQPYYLMDDLPLALLDPSLLDAPLDLSQRIKGSYGGKTYFLDAYLKADASSLDIVGLDSMGTQLFDLSYVASKGIAFSSPAGMSNVRPEYIVADIQLAYYPFEEARKALAKQGLDFERVEVEGGSLRTLSRAGKAIVNIRYGEDSLRFENLLRGYSYEVKESR